ncbi:MAG: lipocalin-like domain-containing protein [Prevotella sp.]
MRKLLYIFATLLMLAACDIHTSNNGDLDGYWQLRSVDTLSTGGTCDMRDSMRFWAFQANLLHVRDNHDKIRKVLMRFSLNNDVMILTDPIIDLRDSSDIVFTDTTILWHYGIHDVPETLKVVTLNSSTMVLENRVLRLNLRKY